MSNVTKGYLFEKKCRDELKANDWIILFKSQRTRFGKVDYASLFDVVCQKGRVRLYISCKVMDNSHGWIKNHKIAIEEFKNYCGLQGERFEIWIKRNKEVEKICI